MATHASGCAIVGPEDFVLSDALNAVCPYYTMYPLAFPLGVLARYAKTTEWVMDPFCGRGTTNFAARLRGQPSFGIDASPVAAAIAIAKTVYASPGAVVATARRILDAGRAPRHVPSGRFWRSAFRASTLRDLCVMREELLHRCNTGSRILLRAIILGALHGPRPKGAPSYFSNQCPRTFAPKPGYAVRFWYKRGLKAPHVDVLKLIAARAKRYLLTPLPSVDARIVHGDARDPQAFTHAPRARWIITSPPYYGMRSYLPDQWLRNWFLGGPPYVEYEHPEQLEHTSADDFVDQLADVWRNVARHARDDAKLIVRFGGLHDRNVEPMDLLRESLRDAGWRLRVVRPTREAPHGRRQVLQFLEAPKNQIVEYDVYCDQG
jgi:hypothetical protein